MRVTVTVRLILSVYLLALSFSLRLSPDAFVFPPRLRHSSSVCGLKGSSLNSGGVNCSLSGALGPSLCSDDARSNQELSSSPSHTRESHLSLDFNLAVLTGSCNGIKSWQPRMFFISIMLAVSGNPK